MSRSIRTRLYDRVSALYTRTKASQRFEADVRPLIKFVEKEVATWSTWFPMPLSRRLWLWRHGFFSYRDRVYDLDSGSKDTYLSDYQRERTARINEPWSVAVDNKLFFHCLTGSFDVFNGHRTAVYGIVDEGRFHPIDGDARPDLVTTNGGTEALSEVLTDRSATVDATSWLLESIPDGEAVVLKPVASGGGNGVERYRRSGDAMLVDGERIGRAELRGRLADYDDTIVCEHVEQATYAADMFPETANTIRIITMWDAETDEPFVPIAAHRIGTEASSPVDNWVSGGLAAEVDLETGTLSRAFGYPESGTVEWTITHPDTGACIVSTQVPGWSEIRRRILDMARTLSHLPYIGWDIVVTGPGEFKIIEANNCPGVTVLQGHRPLLADERVRRFYAEHDVI